jgi:hypothetical protein
MVDLKSSTGGRSRPCRTGNWSGRYLAGRGGGRVKSGSIPDYLGKSNRKMCSRYLSLMDKCGVRLDAFGDSKERQAEI